MTLPHGKAAGAPTTTDQEWTLIEACALSADDCLSRLASRDRGLSEEEAEGKGRAFGPNEVVTRQGGGLLCTWHRLANPLVI